MLISIKHLIPIGIVYVVTITLLSVAAGAFTLAARLEAERETLTQELSISHNELIKTRADLIEYLTEDQFLKNQELNNTIEAIQKTFTETSKVYEDWVELKPKLTSSTKLDAEFAAILYLLSERNYASASSKLSKLKLEMQSEEAKLIAAITIPPSAPVSNTPPGSGYARQQVQLDIGSYLVSIVSADLNTTRVVVDTASDQNCITDCPALPLSDYISRSGAFAGINGPYFCPKEYPSCTQKTNSFDTLLMNKDKTYFNSENNVYSVVPAVIFNGSTARFVSKTSEWGRDTGVDSVIAAQPMLVSNGAVVFGGDGDPKKGSKSTRGFIGTTGSTVYIGHVHNATVAESARVLQALGIQNALNLDGGGSVALWANGGYKVGPGRPLPFGILFVRK